MSSICFLHVNHNICTVSWHILASLSGELTQVGKVRLAEYRINWMVKQNSYTFLVRSYRAFSPIFCPAKHAAWIQLASQSLHRYCQFGVGEIPEACDT